MNDREPDERVRTFGFNERAPWILPMAGESDDDEDDQERGFNAFGWR